MTATAERAGGAGVERFWREVEAATSPANAHVALLGLRTYEAEALHERVEEGLSYEALERLRRVLDVPAARLAELLRIAPRTLARRKDAGRLAADESDRLVRLSRLTGLALQLFEGDVAGTRQWLDTPHEALPGGRAPLELTSTEIGAREVESLIGRLEHGIPL